MKLKKVNFLTKSCNDNLSFDTAFVEIKLVSLKKNQFFNMFELKNMCAVKFLETLIFFYLKVEALMIPIR